MGHHNSRVVSDDLLVEREDSLIAHFDPTDLRNSHRMLALLFIRQFKFVMAAPHPIRSQGIHLTCERCVSAYRHSDVLYLTDEFWLDDGTRRIVTNRLDSC